MVKKEKTIKKEIITKKVIKIKSPSKKKKTPSKNRKSEKVKKIENKKDVEKILIENFTSLQKVMTLLLEKFNTLTGRIDQLLNLFEDSAKAIVKKDFTMDKEKEISIGVLSRIDELLEQNKIIAKSLTMFYETPMEKFEKNKIKKEDELIPPRPIRKPLKGYSLSRGEEIRSPNKRQEELGIKNPFVKEEEENEGEPEFDIPQ